MDFKVSIGVGSRYSWPNGKPKHSEILSDGRTRYTLEDGRTFTVSKPSYVLDYLSTWFGSEPGDTYTIKIALAGLSSVDGFFEVWNFDIGEARSYAFKKTVRITNIETGDTYSAEDLEQFLRPQLGEK